MFLNLKIMRTEVVEDAIAYQLETSGLWRRAVARWLVVMGYSRYTDEEREWLLQRRKYCLAQISPSSQPEKLDISEVAKAADATLKRMGIGNMKSERFINRYSKYSHYIQ